MSLIQIHNLDYEKFIREHNFLYCKDTPENWSGQLIFETYKVECTLGEIYSTHLRDVYTVEYFPSNI